MLFLGTGIQALELSLSPSIQGSVHMTEFVALLVGYNVVAGLLFATGVINWN